MAIKEILLGNWNGLGQKLVPGKAVNQSENFKMEIIINESDDGVITGERKIQSVESSQLYEEKMFIIELIDEFEFRLKWAHSDKPAVFMYMENPVSFQGTYKEEKYTILDNNFIVNEQWQLNLEYQSEESVFIFEFLLDKE